MQGSISSSIKRAVRIFCRREADSCAEVMGRAERNFFTARRLEVTIGSQPLPQHLPRGLQLRLIPNADAPPLPEAHPSPQSPKGGFYLAYRVGKFPQDQTHPLHRLHSVVRPTSLSGHPCSTGPGFSLVTLPGSTRDSFSPRALWDT